MNHHRFRCPACRTRRTSFVALLEHCREHDHKLCTCGGYHHPHRPASPYCHHNPQSAALVAWRDGASDDEVSEISVELALTTAGRVMKVWPYDYRN